jgi:hypothetical protein
MLEALDRTKLCELVKVGCERETAAKCLGLTLEQLEAEIARDETLAKDLLRAEGAAVLAHMGNVRKAASDEKNWRTSVWWLEQYARHGQVPGSSTAEFQAAVVAALDRFAALIVDEIVDVERRQRLMTQLVNITTQCAEAIGSSHVIDVEPKLLTAAPASTVEANHGIEEGAHDSRELS